MTTKVERCVVLHVTELGVVLWVVMPDEDHTEPSQYLQLTAAEERTDEVGTSEGQKW